ncbi:unnamed protein product [Soboliphyme baturini]|uniref:EamA domain-containing protein n=1 Tax=Soboliphyme baturini TaxID=241478 RepID=A0A183IY58_9BILA|nr:unnamed protein product [Soboliphyme baturini]
MEEQSRGKLLEPCTLGLVTSHFTTLLTYEGDFDPLLGSGVKPLIGMRFTFTIAALLYMEEVEFEFLDNLLAFAVTLGFAANN